ncbi:MAG: KH domain-containing protein [Verrucomicrobia bacterium]|nr:KH domain-containing protein [Verrucomicrobiota bacterium]
MNQSNEVLAFGEKAKVRLLEILKLMQFEAAVEVLEGSEDEVLLHIESPDAGRLIGRGATMLYALQYILNRIMSRQEDSSIHCVVDVERYRERRKEQLLQMAGEAADEVEKTGRSVSLPLMGAADRRIVHQALADRAGVVTDSGEATADGRKHVTVSSSELETPPSD